MKLPKGALRLVRYSDERILALCRAGKNEAWRVLMRRHEASLLAWAPRNKVNGQPLVSGHEREAFVAHAWGFVATKIKTFKPGRRGTGRAWLRRVVRSAAGQFRRELRARVTLRGRVGEDVRTTRDAVRPLLEAERLETARERFRRRPAGVTALSWVAAKLVYAFVSFVGAPTADEIRAAGRDPSSLAAAIPAVTAPVGRMGLSPAEVAQLLGMTVNHVHVACHRVRTAIAG